MMSAKAPQPRKKTVYQLGTPFSATTWPQVDSIHQQEMLELLYILLEPLGAYRCKFIEPSKGKRDKKRKRLTDATTKEDGNGSTSHKPLPPAMTEYIDIGLSQITRNLQEWSVPKHDDNPSCTSSIYNLIIVPRSGQPSVLHSHFPELVAAASRQAPSKPIRLLGVSHNCANRLTKAVGLPRVSAIAIRNNAPSAMALIEYAERHVPPVHSPWIESAATEFTFVPPKIIGVPTKIGQRRQRQPPPVTH